MTTLLVAAVSAIVATGPASIGLWRWWTLAPGALALYLIVFILRILTARASAARNAEPAS